MPSGRSLPREIFDVFTGYIRGQIVVWLITTALYLVGFAIIRAPLWYVLGILLPLADWVPHLGPVIGLALAAGITWLGGGGLDRVLMAGAVWLVVETISSYVLQPRIIGRRLGLSPLTVFAVSVAGGLLFGPIGFLLAAPVAGVIAVIWRRVRTGPGIP